MHTYLYQEVDEIEKGWSDASANEEIGIGKEEEEEDDDGEEYFGGRMGGVGSLSQLNYNGDDDRAGVRNNELRSSRTAEKDHIYDLFQVSPVQSPSASPPQQRSRPKRSPSSAAEKKTKTCPICTFDNPRRNEKCEMCQSAL
jgi:hypothetical protein